MIGDNDEVVTEERVVLEKFDGEAAPENLIERLHIVNGEVQKWERIENGEVVEESDTYGGE